MIIKAVIWYLEINVDNIFQGIHCQQYCKVWMNLDKLNVSIVGGFMQILLHVNRGLSNVEILQRGPISLNCRRAGGWPGGSE